jgi:hypothetical protein
MPKMPKVSKIIEAADAPNHSFQINELSDVGFTTDD